MANEITIHFGRPTQPTSLYDVSKQFENGFSEFARWDNDIGIKNLFFLGVKGNLFTCPEVSKLNNQKSIGTAILVGAVVLAALAILAPFIIRADFGIQLSTIINSRLWQISTGLVGSVALVGMIFGAVIMGVSYHKLHKKRPTDEMQALFDQMGGVQMQQLTARAAAVFRRFANALVNPAPQIQIPFVQDMATPITIQFDHPNNPTSLYDVSRQFENGFLEVGRRHNDVRIKKLILLSAKGGDLFTCADAIKLNNRKFIGTAILVGAIFLAVLAILTPFIIRADFGVQYFNNMLHNRVWQISIGFESSLVLIGMIFGGAMAGISHYKLHKKRPAAEVGALFDQMRTQMRQLTAAAATIFQDFADTFAGPQVQAQEFQVQFHQEEAG